METSEFDQLIRNKVNESHDHHSDEIMSSKPFVWTEVRQGLKKNQNTMVWFMLAASLVLILLVSAGLFSKMQDNYQSKYEAIASQLIKVQNGFDNQKSNLLSKENEIESLVEEISLLERKIDQLENTGPVMGNKVIYQTDTVFLTRVEYVVKEEQVSQSPETVIATSDLPELDKNIDPKDSLIASNKPIFPFLEQEKKSLENQSDGLKVKFGSLSSRNK